MCEPISMGLIGAAAGGIMGWGATGTILAGAAAGVGAGLLGKKVLGMIPKAGDNQPTVPKLPEPAAPQAMLTGPKGVAPSNGPGSGFGFGDTMLTGAKGAIPTPSMLGTPTLLGS